MFTNFTDQDYIVRVFTEKKRKGDSNPIIMQNERDKNRYLIITPIFNRSFLINTIETEIEIQEKKIQFPKNIREVIPTCKDFLNRGKDLFRKFVYDLEIFNDYDDNSSPKIFLGIDKEGYELWGENEYWKRVV